MKGTNMTPIEELKFSLRTYNCLRRGRIRYVEELEGKTVDELLTIRGLGDNTLKEIMSVLGRDQLQQEKRYKTWEVLKMLNGNPSRVFVNNFGECMTLRRSESDKNRFELYNPISKQKVDIGYVYFDNRQYQWEEIEASDSLPAV